VALWSRQHAVPPHWQHCLHARQLLLLPQLMLPSASALLPAQLLLQLLPAHCAPAVLAAQLQAQQQLLLGR
jgi:hypothetical protein